MPFVNAEAIDPLATAIRDWLVGHRPMDDALADYQHRRDVLTANVHSGAYQ
jgi:hypothetical protein